MGNVKTYVCKEKITFCLDNFGTKYLEFKEGKKYEFTEITKVFVLKEDDRVIFGKVNFTKHFDLDLITEETMVEDKSKLNFQSDLELDFDMEVQSTLEKIQQLLLVKGVEYRRNSDPFHNFEIGSQISGEIPEKVLQGFLLKHLVSYQDMLNDIEQGKLPKIELVEEKLLDIIVYMVIQKAQIINRIKKS
jgi:hypothetical protein